MSLNLKQDNHLIVSTIATLPSNLLVELKHALSYIDLISLNQIVEKIRLIDEDLANFIQSDVEHFNYEQILSLLSSNLDRHK